MDIDKISIGYASKNNRAQLLKIQRDDIPEDFVDSVSTILEITQYGIDNGCIGHTFAIQYEGIYIGIVILGEALHWECDPEEMSEQPFYRLMGFIIDKRYRGYGIGSFVLEEVIKRIYCEYGVRPIALGVQQDNIRAAKFYLKHGFERVDAMDEDDIYYIRYPR